MKKLLKAISTLFFALAMLVMLAPLNANAAEGVNIVYAKVPADWSNPCVWAWDANGTGAFDAWPGGAMKADPANEGWYYIYVPAGMSNVIVNANEGSVQTSDFSTNDKDAWFVVTSAEEATVTNDKQTAGDLPEYVATYKVFAKVDESWIEPGLWAWSAPDGTNLYVNWPGESMTANTDGFYSAEVPAWVNSVIINANVGSVQTADISVEPKDLWIVVAADGTYELFYEKPAPGADEMVTVHAKVPSDWLLPSLWAWSAPDGTNVFANWPGEELTLDGDWYVYSVPNWVNSIIINGNLGTVQTADISVDAGKDVWVVVSSADAYELSYEEPSASGEAANDDTKVEKTTPAVTETVEETKGLGTGALIGIIAAAVALIAGVSVVVIKKSKKN